MTRFFKRPFDESSGGELASWGTSIFLFEADDALCPVRQLQVFETGHVLRYDRQHQDDHYGGLGDQPLDGDWTPYEISALDFEAAW